MLLSDCGSRLTPMISKPTELCDMTLRIVLSRGEPVVPRSDVNNCEAHNTKSAFGAGGKQAGRRSGVTASGRAGLIPPNTQHAPYDMRDTSLTERNINRIACNAPGHSSTCAAVQSYMLNFSPSPTMRRACDETARHCLTVLGSTLDADRGALSARALAPATRVPALKARLHFIKSVRMPTLG